MKIKKEQNNASDYIKVPLYYDKAFKCMFLKNPKFLKQLIVDYLHFDFEIKTFEIKNSEQFIDNVFERRKVLDIYALINGTEHVSLELNNCNYNTVKLRNIMYANKIYNTFIKPGENLNEINKHHLYQLNLNVCPTIDEPDKRNARICDLETKELIAENYEIVTVNLGKMDKTGYNKSKENAWNIIINSKSYEEMEKFLKNIFEIEDTKYFMKEEEKMQSDEVLLNDWDAEVLNKSINEAEKENAKKEGIRVGEAKGEARGIEIGEERGEARKEKNLIENMFKNGIDISLISKVTSVPIKQLQKIKTSLFL